MKSINPCKSRPVRQAGVVQTIYDILKAHGEEISVETNGGEGAGVIVTLSGTSLINLRK